MLNKTKQKGFTLLEVLLVLAVMSTILVMIFNLIQQRMESARQSRTVMQMQQILNAGLTYYVANGSWPPNLLALQGNYLPAAVVSFKNPYGNVYNIGTAAPTANAPPLFYVWTDIRNSSDGQVIAGSLPFAYVTKDTSTPPIIIGSCSAGHPCNVVSTVTIPGQNLNNARAMNFAGVYHSGACVPVPQCPVDTSGNTMTPEIFVVPMQVSGIDTQPTGCGSPDSNGKITCTNISVSPISSFSAYATASAVATSSSGPAACTVNGVSSSGTAKVCLTTPGTPLSTLSGTYWRVCLSIVTPSGAVSPGPSGDNPTPAQLAWGQSSGTIAAFTRCATPLEASQGTTTGGSNVNVWAQ